MHAFMYNKADINPLATCSTSAGYKRSVNEAAKQTPRSEDDDVPREKSTKKLKTTPQDKRHQENLERKDRFLAFDRCVFITSKICCFMVHRFNWMNFIQLMCVLAC